MFLQLINVSSLKEGRKYILSHITFRLAPQLFNWLLLSNSIANLFYFCENSVTACRSAKNKNKVAYLCISLADWGYEFIFLKVQIKSFAFNKKVITSVLQIIKICSRVLWRFGLIIDLIQAFSLSELPWGHLTCTLSYYLLVNKKWFFFDVCVWVRMYI